MGVLTMGVLTDVYATSELTINSECYLNSQLTQGGM